MKTKTFDCVEMKRRGAEHVYSIIKDMTPEQEVEYWRKRTEELRQEQATIRARTSPKPPAQTKP
ncbi:MAG: hypothetical protein ABR964_06390 [Tepidisphaeraceae bacterium]